MYNKDIVKKRGDYVVKMQDKEAAIASIVSKLEKLDRTGLLLMDNGAQLLVIKQQLENQDNNKK